MDNIKAIEEIRKNICNEESPQHHCKDMCMYGVEHCAYSLAIAVLERTMPKNLECERSLGSAQQLLT